MNKEKDAAANVPTPNELENQASASRNNNEASTSTENREKDIEESIVHGGSTDFSRVPIPVCSCTGVRRECQKLDSGWRSTCCTADLLDYPLPSTSSRRKGRISGRTISKGAYKKILERLAAEGHDLSRGVDLKNHWVRPEKHTPRSYHHEIISLSMNEEKEVVAKVPTPDESENQASASRNNNEASTSTENREKNIEESIVHGGSTDFSRVPIPVCSCTGVRRECQKLDSGWRSTCCTADLSEDPLPLTSSRRKGRISGRTISKGTYKKILERLAAEGHDLSRGVDLKDHWVHPAKHTPRSYHHDIISLSMNEEKDAAANIPTPDESENQASASRNNNEASTSTENREKNIWESIVHGGSTDFSHVPIPVCSCTGVRRECQKFASGWRSTCCTADLLEDPLPSTSSRRKGRILGRTISNGAYKKILERLAAEGHDLSRGVDLKNHWPRTGTNQHKSIK